MISIPQRTPRPIPPLSSRVIVLPTGETTSQLEIVRALHRSGKPGLTLAQYVSAAWETLEPSVKLQWNWHLDVICEHVEALLLDRHGPNLTRLIEHVAAPLEADGKEVNRHKLMLKILEKRPALAVERCPQNLMMNVPPGSMKSLIFSVFAPSWKWLFNPGWRAIYASGNPAVVTRDSLKARQLVTSSWYRDTFKPDWQLSEDQNEKQHFANTKGGFRRGVGAGGTVTGDRADFLGVDDANDAKEIQQKSHRVQINENWWDAAFHNRVADPTFSKRGNIMQRLHEEDLAGYTLEKEKGKWGHLVIQMEAESRAGDKEVPGDEVTWLGYRDPRKLEGELMFPERFTPEYLAGELQTLASSGYAGQMQQRPVAAEGNRFKRDWWRFWSPSGESQKRPKGANAIAPLKWDPAVDLRRCYQVISSWDCTFKDTDGTDYVVGLVVAIDGARRIVLERVRDRMSFTETVKQVKTQKGAPATREEPAVDGRWPQITEVIVEDKANGPAVVKTLEDEVSGLIAVNPEGGKESRAAIMEPKVEAGNWYLPEGAAWLDEWFNEYGAFPKGKFDDQVDAGSQVECRLLGDSDEANTRALLGLPVVTR